MTLYYCCMPFNSWLSHSMKSHIFWNQHFVAIAWQGLYRSWKTWKVMEFKNFIFQAWKVMEPWKTWKIKVFFVTLDTRVCVCWTFYGQKIPPNKGNFEEFWNWQLNLRSWRTWKGHAKRLGNWRAQKSMNPAWNSY